MIQIFLLFLVSFCYCQCQLKDCFYANGRASPDYPCDPDAEVSACCGAAFRCYTNLFCQAAGGVRFVGSCTDRTFQDARCPWPLNSTVDRNSIFRYPLNTTICNDSTVCPGPGNKTCCDARGGKSEINYHNLATIPSAIVSLSTYYSLAGYDFTCDRATSDPAATTPTSSKPSENQTQSTFGSSISSPTSISTSTPITSSTSPLIPTGTSIPTPTGTGKTSGLSASAQGGIAAGVVVGIAFPAILGFLLYKQRQKTAQAMNSLRFTQQPVICLEPSGLNANQRLYSSGESNAETRLTRLGELSG